MKKDPKIFLMHILESILSVKNYTNNISKTEFLSNIQMQDAVIRRLEIIGEAVKNLSMPFRSAHSEISWQKISGMRDVLIHGYFGVDINLVWNIIEKDIPNLERQIRNLLNILDKENV